MPILKTYILNRKTGGQTQKKMYTAINDNVNGDRLNKKLAKNKE